MPTECDPVERLADAVDALADASAVTHTDLELLKQEMRETRAAVERNTLACSEARVDTARRQGAPWPLVYSLVSFTVFLVLVLIGLYATSRGDDAGKAFDDAAKALPLAAPSGTVIP